MKNYKITVNGIAYDVTVEETDSVVAQSVQTPVQPKAAPAPAAPAVPAAEGSVKIEAPMPGTILDVRVSKGDSVSSGQVLIVLEAMKMENEIVAPSAGTVASLNVNKGDTVDSGQVLVTLS